MLCNVCRRLEVYLASNLTFDYSSRTSSTVPQWSLATWTVVLDQFSILIRSPVARSSLPRLSLPRPAPDNFKFADALPGSESCPSCFISESTSVRIRPGSPVALCFFQEGYLEFRGLRSSYFSNLTIVRLACSISHDCEHLLPRSKRDCPKRVLTGDR